MLIITRRVGEAIRIKLSPAVDPRTPVGELFAAGPIEVVVARVRDASVRLGISADPAFVVLREELDAAGQAPACVVTGTHDG